MSGYVTPFVATFVVVLLLSRIVHRDSAWRSRIPSLGFALAAVIWLMDGIMQHAIVSIGLALVFFTLAISLGGYPSRFLGQNSHDEGEPSKVWDQHHSDSGV